jgi:hypothetical protein
VLSEIPIVDFRSFGREVSPRALDDQRGPLGPRFNDLEMVGSGCADMKVRIVRALRAIEIACLGCVEFEIRKSEHERCEA